MVMDKDDKVRARLREYKQYCSDLFYDLIANGPGLDDCDDPQDWEDAFSDVICLCRMESYEVKDYLEAINGS